MVKDLEAELLAMGDRERNLSETLDHKEALIADFKAKQKASNDRLVVDKQI